MIQALRYTARHSFSSPDPTAFGRMEVSVGVSVSGRGRGVALQPGDAA